MRLRNDPNSVHKLLQSNFLVKNFPFYIDENFVMEIGMGKGEMLYQLALNNPHINYLGIEKYPTVAAKIIKKAENQKLNNFFIINQDVAKLETQIIGQVKEIWLTFSDPWPKKRHEKRRLTHPDFLKIYQTFLSDQGILKIKTDNDAFFEYSVKSIVNFGGRILNLSTDFHKSELSKNNIMTGYEKKWSSLGKNINYMEVQLPPKQEQEI